MFPDDGIIGFIEGATEISTAFSVMMFETGTVSHREQRSQI